MARNLSQLISILFHPLFLPLYATWLLLNSDNYLTYAVPDKFQQYLYLVIFISTALLPASLTWMMWQKGWISSMEMEDRKERSIPYLITLSCYVATVYLLFRLPLPRLFALTIVGAGIAILLAFLINLRWKISIHMIGIGGLMGLFYGYGKFFHMKVLNITILMAVVAGIIAAARLYRSSHTPSQVYAGFIAGFSVELGVLYYLQY